MEEGEGAVDDELMEVTAGSGRTERGWCGWFRSPRVLLVVLSLSRDSLDSKNICYLGRNISHSE